MQRIATQKQLAEQSSTHRAALRRAFAELWPGSIIQGLPGSGPRVQRYEDIASQRRAYALRVVADALNHGISRKHVQKRAFAGIRHRGPVAKPRS